MNSDPGCWKATDPDMALGSSQGTPRKTPQVHVATQGAQISLAPVAAWPLVTNKATGCGLDPRHICDLWWQHGPWTLCRPWLL